MIEPKVLHGEPTMTKEISRPDWKNDPSSTADDKALVLGAVGSLLQSLTPLLVVFIGLTAGAIGALRESTGLIDIAKIVTSGGIGAIAATRNSDHGDRNNRPPGY